MAAMGTTGTGGAKPSKPKPKAKSEGKLVRVEVLTARLSEFGHPCGSKPEIDSAQAKEWAKAGDVRLLKAETERATT